MRLTRITERLARLDGTALAVELVIVILGVFIGLQVDNWNDARREAQRGDDYLQRIHGDLAVDVKEMDDRLVFWGAVVAYGHAAIRHAETGENVRGAAWPTVLAFFQASQLYPYIPRDTTYQEMRNAGDLGLIRDAALRTALANYYVNGLSVQAGYLLRLEPEYRRIVRGLTPQAVSTHVWAHCHESFEQTRQRLIECDAPIGEDAAKAILEAYRAEPRLLAELRFWITNLEVSRTLIAGNREAALALASRLPADTRE